MRNPTQPSRAISARFAVLFLALWLTSWLVGCGRMGFDPVDVDTSPYVLGSGDAAVPFSVLLEAESGLLTSPFTVRSDPSASGGQYVQDGTSSTGHASSGSARYDFTVDSDGTYYVWGRTRAPSADVDSFFVYIDGVGGEYDTSRGEWSEQWRWTAVGTPGDTSTVDRPFALTAGDHVLGVQSREAGTTLDAILVTNDPDGGGAT